MADGAAAAPRLQELLQRLVGSITLAWSDSPPPPLQPRQDAPSPTQGRSWDAAGPEGQTGLACTRSGRRWLSMARYPSRLCSTGVCKRSRASRHRLPGRYHPPAWPELPREPRAGVPEQEWVWAKGRAFPRNGHCPSYTSYSHVSGAEAARSPPCALTVNRYCRNRSFWVITNRAFLLFKTRFPNSRART